jgi:hypothetical protein
MTHEALRKEVPRFKFKPEQIVTEDDPEFFDELRALLEVKGYKPDELLYSGFDGEPILNGRDVPRYDFIFAMNTAGWREALRTGQENPAVYAFGVSKNPVLGLYDQDLLALARPHDAEPVDFNAEDFNYNDRLKFAAIDKWDDISDLPESTVIEETVVHKNYPDSSPTDALVGLVFLDRE